MTVPPRNAEDKNPNLMMDLVNDLAADGIEKHKLKHVLRKILIATVEQADAADGKVDHNMKGNELKKQLAALYKENPLLRRLEIRLDDVAKSIKSDNNIFDFVKKETKEINESIDLLYKDIDGIKGTKKDDIITEEELKEFVWKQIQNEFLDALPTPRHEPVKPSKSLGSKKGISTT